MIVVVSGKATKNEVDNLVEYIGKYNVKIKETVGENHTILGLVGDTVKIDIDALGTFPAVESVKRVQEPYKLVNRKFHEADSIVKIGDYAIGGGNFQVIAGPCSVESEEQILEVAQGVYNGGARILRGGAFKPRSSPYAFQGLEGEGLNLLAKAKEKTGMPIVTEIMSADDIPLFDNVDLVQVGARNMQNFRLLKALGKINKPILLKRGLANTIEEWLMSAEYIMAGGNENVILCERGIRTFETATRNTLDLSAIPVIKKKSHLPIIVDPSHAVGVSSLVEPMALAAVSAGADGLIIEVHNNPQKALCDGAQSLTIEQFNSLNNKIGKLSAFMKEIDR